MKRQRSSPVRRIKCLSADPPWKHNDTGIRGGTKRQYATMTTAKICRFKLPPLGRSCFLWLWVAHNFTEDAFKVARAWGFDRYRSEGVWVKLTKDGSKVKIGGGHTLRQAHEKYLLFSRGNPRRRARNVASVIHSPHPRDRKGRIIHSAKPEKFYRMVDLFCSGPKAELFARRQWKGWLCLGKGMPRGKRPKVSKRKRGRK